MKPKSYRDHLHKAISVETRMKLIINIIFVTLTTNTYLNFETWLQYSVWTASMEG